MAVSMRMTSARAMALRAAPTTRRSLVVRSTESNNQTPAVAEEAPINSVSVEPIPAVQAVPAAAAAAPTPTAPSLFELMSFSSPIGPELWNSRLAMLGLFAAVGAELSTGQSALTQFENNTPIVLATWALIAVASFIPMLKGADPTAAFGPFTRAAEVANGRAAMLGIAGLLIVELTKGGALF